MLEYTDNITFGTQVKYIANKIENDVLLYDLKRYSIIYYTSTIS